jgi:glycosyl transferase, family 25
MLPSVIVINLDRDKARLQHMSAQLRNAGLTFRRFSAVDGANLPSAPTLVLEDDVSLPANLRDVLRRLLATLPAGWDIVRLSYPSKRAAIRIEPLENGFELVRYSQVPLSTGAYLLSRSGAIKMLARRSRSLPIDHDLRRVWAWNLNTYGVSPPPVVNDTLGTSSIDAMAPGARAEAWRTNRIKRNRLFESVDRLRYGVNDFGAWRWFAMEALNVVGRALPRPRRAAVFAWGRQALAWPRRRVRIELAHPTPSHIHAVGGLRGAAHPIQRRTLRRGGQS